MRKGFDLASDIKLCQCYGSYSYFLFPVRHKLMHTYSQRKQIRCTNKCKDNVENKKTQIAETRTHRMLWWQQVGGVTATGRDRQTLSYTFASIFL